MALTVLTTPHTEGHSSHLKARKRALTRNQANLHLDFGPITFGLGENKCLLFRPPGLWYFVTAAPADSYDRHLNSGF